MKYQLIIIRLFLLLTFTVHAAPPFTALVAPLLKDTNSSVYTINLYGDLYVIDLDATFTWFVCNQTFPFGPPCTYDACLQARAYISPLCPPSNSTTIQPPCRPCYEDCYAPIECDTPCKHCTVPPVNPVAQTCVLSLLTYRDLILYWTNGRNTISPMNFNQLLLSCAPASLLQSLPSNILGVASLSWSPLALSSQFTGDYLGVAHKFAFCLPSSSEVQGVTFFGDGPYHFFPTDIDVKSLLSYTPLVKNPKSPSYYISVHRISVGGKALPISLGDSTAKLSTVVPYTTLRSDVYKFLTKTFSKGVKHMLHRVNAIKPFSLCFKASAKELNQTAVLRVPQIDLQLGNGSIWSIYGPNSMKRVGNDVACLGFIDGGKKPENAIVIGSYQIENNFLFFDLENSMLGFSSTLLSNNISCSNFNFTSVPAWP